MPTAQPENELVRVRLQKLDNLRAMGIDPFPNKYKRTHTASEAICFFEAHEKKHGADTRTESVCVAGRIVAFRDMGSATFVDLKEGPRQIQTLLRKNILTDSYDILANLDLGDWIGVQGPIFRTRTQEITIEAHNFTLLCKSLRPLPEKYHGLTDVEARYRQRYLDLIVNDEARHTAVLRSQIVSSMRKFMEGHGFIEVETPILVQVAAGGMAHPFVTHYNALDRDLYLRIAHELYLKRLIVGGMEKVYEIGKAFRNEGIDHLHNPEYTMMESYEAFADYTDVMHMVETMVSTIANEVLGSTTVDFNGQEIDFTPPWPRLSLIEEIKARSGIDILEHPDIESLQSEMRLAGVDVRQQTSRGGLLDKLISVMLEPNFVQPCFLVDYPVEMSPLSKKKRDDPRLVERFEGFVAGMEICNAFTELNDPIDQRKRFEDQEALRATFENEETDRLDEDYLTAIEYGMPPTGGLGIGVDRLSMLLSGHRSIREVILFPQLRSR